MLSVHERQNAYLNRVLEKRNPAHAYVFSGPAGSGKFFTGVSFIKALFCEEHPKTMEAACEACRECLSLNERAHPNAFFLGLESTLTSKKEKRKEIPIDDIRELKRLFALASVKSAWRAAIINGAEHMSREAAAAFLKLLEEPGKNTVFILTTESARLLMPTILSRAQKIEFPLISDGRLYAFLKAREVHEGIDDIVRLSGGRAGYALELAGDKELLAKERAFAKSLRFALSAGVPEALNFAEKISADPEMRKKAVRVVFCILGEIARKRQDEKPVIQAKKIQRIAEGLEFSNVNPRLALDAMFLELKALL